MITARSEHVNLFESRRPHLSPILIIHVIVDLWCQVNDLHCEFFVRFFLDTPAHNAANAPAEGKQWTNHLFGLHLINSSFIYNLIVSYSQMIDIFTSHLFRFQ